MSSILIIFGFLINWISSKEIVQSNPIQTSIFTKRFSNKSDASLGRASFRDYIGSRDYSYHYEVPMKHYLPPFGDELPPETTTQTIFIEDHPPFHDEPVPSQGYVYEAPRVPFDDLQPPVSHDELPAVEIPNRDYLPTRSGFSAFDKGKNVHPLHLEVNEMHCFETPLDGRFQAVLTVKSKNENVPVFEDAKVRKGYCEINEETKPPLFDTNLRINVTKDDFNKCGIKDCSFGEHKVNMCVRLRFPTVAKMRLPEDPVLTLQCRTQDRVASDVKHINFNVDNSIIARSGGVVAKGGHRGNLRTKVALYRRGVRGDFSEALLPRAKVPLGDTIMLRADVESGDGWTSSRFGNVVMRRENIDSSSEEVALLQSDGCRSSEGRLLCPKDPISSSPLKHTLFLRAALFEGMTSGEVVRLSVGLVACLEPEDCRPSRCEGGAGGGPSRVRRRSPRDVANATSELSFVVVVPASQESVRGFRPSSDNSVAVVCVVAVLVGVVLVGLIVLALKNIKGGKGLSG